MAELTQRIQIEHQYQELFEQLKEKFISIGVKHNLLFICAETFSWCFKIHTIVQNRVKLNGFGTKLNGDDTTSSSSSGSDAVDSRGPLSTEGNVSLEIIQNILKEGTLLESRTTEIIRTFSESSMELLKGEECSPKGAQSNDSSVSVIGKEDDVPNHSMLLTNYTTMCNEDVQRSEYCESLCFELVEYWRQKLIMILMEISSKDRDNVLP